MKVPVEGCYTRKGGNMKQTDNFNPFLKSPQWSTLKLSYVFLVLLQCPHFIYFNTLGTKNTNLASNFSY